MTRINFGIHPRELTNKHLLAEHREIKRIPNSILNGIAKFREDHSDIPRKFSLGKGHVKFFYNKIIYLHKRYNLLLLECTQLRFNVTDYNDCFEKCAELFPSLYKDAKPTNSDSNIIRERIRDRLSSKPQKFSSWKGNKYKTKQYITKQKSKK